MKKEQLIQKLIKTLNNDPSKDYLMDFFSQCLEDIEENVGTEYNIENWTAKEVSEIQALVEDQDPALLNIRFTTEP